MTAIAAFVGPAVLAIALTRAPARSDASLSYGLSGRACLTSGLEAWLGLGAATAARPGSAGPPGAYPGHVTYYTLEFTNVSNRTCSLFGYPEVSAFRDSPAAAEPARKITMAVMNSFLRPYMSPSFPYSGVVMVDAST